MVVNFQVEALVLRSRDFGDKDVMLTLLSKERGKITIICKGVKKPVSRLRAAAQLFTHAKFYSYEGKSLSVATQAETIESFRSLSTDLTKFAAASFWGELTELLLPEKEMNFHAYLLLLKALRLLDNNFSWALFLAFQVKILSLMGYEPVVGNCVTCGGKLLDTPKYLSPREGGTQCLECSYGKQTAEGIIQAIRLFKEASLETITKVKLSSSVTTQIRKFLNEYIEFHTEHRLRSSNFLHVME